MPAYKDKEKGTWYAILRYTDWKGETKQKLKRSFPTKREALEWEQEFKQRQSRNLDMSFDNFFQIYKEDIEIRLKQNTWLTKENIIITKILPTFSNMKMSDITPADVIQWQNEMLAFRDNKGQPYAKTYLKTIHNQLSAVFNHAVRFYDLRTNPASKAGNMGSGKGKEMLFWTKEEYIKFSDSMMDKPISFYAFEILYWCGIRLGELLALTPKDFDFEKGNLFINKSYQRIKKQDVITEPKTPKSNRTITLPDFLIDSTKYYIDTIYGCKKNDRIFPISKSYLRNEMIRGSKEQELQRIRVHDLRHSHVSLLIDLDFSAVAIADRMGHESIEITYQYAHLFPTKQAEIADRLSLERSSDIE